MNNTQESSYPTQEKKVEKATSKTLNMFPNSRTNMDASSPKLEENMDTNSVNSNTIKPEHFQLNHWEEWLSSGISKQIICLNFSSLNDSRELDKILNRNNRSRCKHSDDLVPAWCVSGIDPQTDEQSLEGVQVKPDNPSVRNGKPQKYLSASGYGVAPLFLNNGIENYWLQVIQDKSIPVIILEGAKKAGCVLSLGIAAISIPGVSTCRKKGRLHKLLQLFCGYGRTFYLGFDNDLMSKKSVQDALLNLSRDLSATGSKVMVLQFPEGEAKGADDYIVANGAESFENLVGTAKTIEEWKDEIKEFWILEQERIKETKKSKLARYLHIIKLGWGEGLRFNRLKNQIDMNGEPLDLEQVRLRIALEFDMDVPAYDAMSIVEVLARQQAYHPVQEYLEDVAAQHPEPNLSILDNLATRYLGSNEELHNIYMRKTLIAAVARIYQPGCQHDAATIFIGKQYAGKSSFWRKLFGREFFSDQLGEATKSEDELAKVHQFWGLEWSEFETVYRKKDVASLKKFMSASVDAFRLPYARTTKEYPRQSILVGTSNETEILNDPTGSRRFWIIPISQESIPLDLLEQERDQLWAAAYRAYQDGEQWELSRADRLKQAEMNKDYETQDPWYEKILSYLRDKTSVAIEDIFYHLAIEPSRQDMGLTKRVSGILRQLNWDKTRKYLNGAWLRVWEEAKTKVTFLGGSRGIESNDVFFDANTTDQYEKTKVTFLGGSRGSSEIDVIVDTQNQTLESGINEQVKNDFLPDVSELKEDSVTHYTVSKKSDSLVDRVDNQSVEEIQKNNEQLDPRDPPKNQTFFSNDKSSGVGFAPSSVPPVFIKFASAIGVVEAIATPAGNGKYDFQITYPGFEEVDTITVDCADNEKATKFIKRRVGDWRKKLRFSVMQVPKDDSLEYVWIENCQCVDFPVKHSHKCHWVFDTPDGDRIRVASEDEFRLES